MDIYEKAAELIALSKKKKTLQEELDGINAAEEALEKDLYWTMMSGKLYELESGGYVLRPVMKLNAIAKDDRTIRVLRRRGFGELVKPTVHPSTASSFVRKQMEENGGELPKWIADNFSVVCRETISVRRD